MTRTSAPLRPAILLLGSLLAGIGVRAVAAPPLVVETDALTPQAQRDQFRLPPGFEIELVACEPDIGQPMNLNFDAAGRLWVTHSVEYPYPVAGTGIEPRDERFGPASLGPPRDRVSIISGIGTGDVTLTHFADGLNIPIGIVPLSSEAAVGFSIPNVVKWEDSDRDGKAETAGSVLYGPFGNVDTHGLVNGLTWWLDGWIYACHGFRNTSSVRGADGHEIVMNSGNTFRFRPDGSRIEQYTHGQVNPFGLTFDPWGNLYTADCHSMPLTCLIPGAYYPSFGKPHDGLGFGPNMIDHSHGSTGICGPCYYAADHFPPDFRDCIYLCNPVTGSVHRDRLIWHGSTPQVDTQPDFITCADGWFRPVDIQLGPDGALYVADFYNAIIGHYEVPLEHPRRDRTHGRIWRVTYTGDRGSGADRSTRLESLRDDQSGHSTSETADAQRSEGTHRLETRAPVMPDLTGETLEQLIERLGDPNLTVCRLAFHRIAQRDGGDAVATVRSVLKSAASPQQSVHAMWLLHRFQALSSEDRSQLCTHESPLVRTHLARILGSFDAWDEADESIAATLIEDNSAMVRRAAAEAWARHPREEIVETLVRLMPPPDGEDTHLRHAMRIALRESVRKAGVLSRLSTSRSDASEIAAVCLGIGSPEAAAYLLRLQQSRPDAALSSETMAHIGRYGTNADVESLVSLARRRTDGDVREELAAIRALTGGLNAPVAAQHQKLHDWATQTARQLLEEAAQQPAGWTSHALAGGHGPAAGWSAEIRRAADGHPTRLWSSFPHGEQGVGVYRSQAFELPQRLTFWIAGHDGFPQNQAAGRNVVRLIRDDGGRVLRSVPVPRQDPPVIVQWDFNEAVGQAVRIELVDGLDLNAYAWVAAGRFSLESLNPPEDVPSELAAELIGGLQLDSLRPDIERMLADRMLSTVAVRHLAEAHLQLEPDARLQAMLPWLDGAEAGSFGAAVRKQLIRREDERIDELLGEAMRLASSERQRAMAEALAGSRDGARKLIALVTAGHASPRLLTAASVLQKLQVVGDESLQTRIAELIRNLPPANQRLSRLIAEGRSAFDAATSSPERGKVVFKRACAACHQVGGEGNKVGPQLDGIGLRGIDRLLEDVLDPNRNVDAAFRSTTIVTRDGRVLSGLLRREEPDALVLADVKGEEFRVALVDVEEQALSPLSLMPEEVAEKLPPVELNDLLAFLLAQTAK